MLDQNVVTKYLDKSPVKGYNPEVLRALNYLETRLSEKGLKVVEKFLEGRANGGHNRDWHIVRLAEAFAKDYNYFEPYMTKTSLRSYSNTTLHELITTGDLKKSGRCLIPNN